MASVEEILGTVSDTDILKTVTESEKLRLLESQESVNSMNLLTEDELHNLVFFDPLDNNVKKETKIKTEITEQPLEIVQKQEDPGDDDETIATFLTATGEQLALYAVEDSDEIFAVALYDETGIPPTDFQFLMKSDVERLIGEGAVTTVKRPQPKQPTTIINNKDIPESPILSKSPAVPISQSTCINIKASPQKLSSFSPIRRQQSSTIPQKNTPSVTTTVKPLQKASPSKPQQAMTQIIKTPQNQVTKVSQKNVLSGEKKIIVMEKTYQPLDRKLVSPIRTPVSTARIFEVKKEPVIPKQVVVKSEPEDATPKTNSSKLIKDDQDIIEQSTVQYILCDDGDSGSELTFDDIKNLQAFGSTNKVFSPLKLSKTLPANRRTYQNSSQKNSPRMLHQSPSMIVITQPASTNRNLKKRQSLSMTSTKVRIKQEIEDCFQNDQYFMKDLPAHQSSFDDSLLEDLLPMRTKVRSRKQQLTVVNRTDSDEIIIQPASAYSEGEEEEPSVPKGRKRGRKKKKLSRDPDYNPRFSPPKKSSKRSVEVIDLDNDGEGEQAGSGKSKLKKILEITLDDNNKEKDSSDKENDVIMVGDSEVDSEDEEGEDEQTERKKRKRNTAMECDHCLRIYRQRTALERHLQTCPNLPEHLKPTRSDKSYKAQKSYKKNAFNRSKPTPGKKFPCKVCGEIFDMPLSVARHVRLKHSQGRRKSAKHSKGYVSENEESEAESTAEEVVGNLKVTEIQEKEVSIEVDEHPNEQTESTPEEDIEKQIDKSPEREERRQRSTNKKEKVSEKSINGEIQNKESSEVPKDSLMGEDAETTEELNEKEVEEEEKMSGRSTRAKKLQCNNCQKSFQNQGALISHCLKEHKNEKVEETTQLCSVCKKQIPAPEYDEHSLSHQTENAESPPPKLTSKKRQSNQDNPKPRRSTRLQPT